MACKKKRSICKLFILLCFCCPRGARADLLGSVESEDSGPLSSPNKSVVIKKDFFGEEDKQAKPKNLPKKKTESVAKKSVCHPEFSFLSREEELHFQGEGVLANKLEAWMELEKNVLIKQGGVVFSANWGKIIQDQVTKDLKRILVKGDVKIKNFVDCQGERWDLSGDQGDYRVDESQIHLEGHVLIVKNKNKVFCEKATYYIEEGVLRTTQTKGFWAESNLRHEYNKK